MNIFDVRDALLEEVKDFAAVGLRPGLGGLILSVWGTPPDGWQPYIRYEGWPVETKYIGEIKADGLC